MNIVGERVVIRISMTILMDVRSSFFKVSEGRDAECIPFFLVFKKNGGKSENKCMQICIH